MHRTTLLVSAAALAACDASRPSEPRLAPTTPSAGVASADAQTDSLAALAREVRVLAAQRGVFPLAAPPRVRRPLAQLGRALAFDPILSGGRDVSCMTCHVPAFGTGDGRSLSIGQGGSGLGPARTHPGTVFIPLNAPALFNLGAARRLFWDGRVELDAAGRLHTPAGAQLTPEMARVLEFGPVSALALFPVTNRAEMRGDMALGAADGAAAANELATLKDDDFAGIWRGLMERLGRIPEYRRMFEAAYPGTRFRDMTFAHASNAIGAFFVSDLTFTRAPWDRFLGGHDDALTPRQLDGARTFLTLKCSLCHNGATLSDEDFHNVAVAQLGPGQGNGPGGRDDFGRMNVTGRAEDLYRFRTTSLRNVELTAPYGHSGAILDLRAFVEHYSESDKKLLGFDAAGLEPSLRGSVLPNASAILATRDTLLDGVVLADSLVGKLMDYMQALTDEAARDLRRVVPRRVPSGLPVERPRE